MQGGRNFIKRLAARFARPLADDRGAVLVYVSLGLTVFMGMAALAIDASRVFTLQTEMQSAADAFALAAAAELDGNADAQARANAAVANMVQNNQTFATGAHAIAPGNVTVIYYSSIPNDDQALPSTGTTDSTLTRFVRVQVNQRQTTNIFAEFIGGGATATATAQAVAGFTQAVCKFTPLFICNPYADQSTLLQHLDNWDSDPDRRKLIILKKWAGNGQLSPGNFGFLQPATGPGASNLKASLGLVDPGTCFSQSGVNLQTGNIASARDAINTRFDLYDGSFNNKSNDPLYRPAENVIKGYTVQHGNACSNQNQLDPTNALALPLDTAWTDLGSAAARWGNGQWDCNAYWDMNHGNRNGNYTDDAGKPAGCSDPANTTLSRYELYRDEVTGGIPNKSNLNPKGENGNPQCNTGSVSDSPDRRILYAAVLNCPPANGSADNLPVLAFVKMFITQPMSKNNNSCNPNNDPTCETDTGDLFVEVIGGVKPGADDDILHDMVQLYK